MSCARCFNLRPETLNSLKPGQVSTLFIDEYELAKSAQNASCPECKLLYDSLSLRKSVWADTPHTSSVQLMINVGKPLRVRAWSDRKAIDISIFHQLDNNVSKINNPAIPDTIGYGVVIPRNSGSIESLESIATWYAECVSTHALCRIDDKPQLPTRVIDLGMNLALTANVSLRPTACLRDRYVALSYCWGDAVVHRALKTTRATIHKHMKGIPFTNLPLTLQHAVILTRTLNIRYLWIDALCIIQDDVADWARESKTMGDVYGKATLTIVACKADGSSGGIFNEQDYSISTQIPYRSQHVTVSNDFQRAHKDKVEVHLNETIDPIHLRAWTYQEAILSTRAVYFTSQELRWECNSARRCQCGQLSQTLPSTYDPENLEYENHRIWRLQEFFPATVEEAYQNWYYVYSEFTSRLVTNEPDRLVALSGLAQRFAAMMKAKFGRDEKYLAGIWAGSLPRELLWRVQPKEQSVLRGLSHGRPKVWRAPSWSWASMEAMVSRRSYFSIRMLTDVLSAEIEPAGLDLFGQVMSGSLCLRGPVLRGLQFTMDPTAAKGTFERFPSVKYEGYDLLLTHLYIDNDLGDETEKSLTSKSSEFVILVIGYESGGDVHDTLVLKTVQNRPSTFTRYGWVQLGPHLREPSEHKEAITNAPRGVVILL